MILFVVFSLLSAGHTVGGYDVLDEVFTVNYQNVCPGQSVIIPKARGYDDLFFRPHGSESSKHVANKTEIFLPSYKFKGKDVLIPEVTEQFEGTYFWTHAILLTEGFSTIIEIKKTKVTINRCAQTKEAYYGDTFALVRPKEASILEFTPEESSDTFVLWSRINPEKNRGARGSVKPNTWAAKKATHLDAGRYVFKTESGIEISSTRLFPREQLIYHDIRKEHFLERRLPVLIHKAVVTFIDASRTENVVFDSGVQTDTGFLIFTHRLQIMPQSNELMFTIKDLQSSDVGRYEISGLGGLAAVIWLSESSAWSEMDLAAPIGISAAIIVLIICCCCLRKLCNTKCAVPRPAPNNPQPAVYIHSSNEVTSGDPEPYLSAVPSGTSAAATGGSGAHPAPSASLDPGIQYQPKGWGGDPGDFLTSAPLSMDTDTGSSAYNSDKLNF